MQTIGIEQKLIFKCSEKTWANLGYKTGLLTVCKLCDLLIYSNIEHVNLTKH